MILVFTPPSLVMRISLAFLFVLSPLAVSAQFSTATYTVEFEATWSAVTHPDDFPPNPHFSGLIGASHNDGTSLWNPGGLATPGIQSMAETGSKTLLEGEINTMIGGGTAFEIISGGGIGTSPGTVSVSFDVNTDFPLVSLVSMLAPSPDWFVGVHGMSMREDNDWVDFTEVTLFTYDAGTDSGPMYTSPNSPTNPADPIELIDGYPFFYSDEIEPVGVFRFTLDNVVSNELETPEALALSLTAPYPNPATSTLNFSVELPRAEIVQIDVFDLLGRKIQTVSDMGLSSGSHPVTLDVSTLPFGVFILQARAASEIVTRRFVVR